MEKRYPRMPQATVDDFSIQGHVALADAFPTWVLRSTWEGSETRGARGRVTQSWSYLMGPAGDGGQWRGKDLVRFGDLCL